MFFCLFSLSGFSAYYESEQKDLIINSHLEEKNLTAFNLQKLQLYEKQDFMLFTKNMYFKQKGYKL